MDRIRVGTGVERDPFLRSQMGIHIHGQFKQGAERRHRAHLEIGEQLLELGLAGQPHVAGAQHTG
jgi:hypothetical protein